jgi:hypothetical protein|tara:strand:- start:33 stop:824 length:792 start_codon:yes stop_codon:yes gene_type:complete
MGYFQVEAKPFVLPSEQHANDNLATTKALADWTAFEIPKGAARLVGMTVIYRGKNGVDVAPVDFEIIWAKSNPDGSAPTSLATVATVVGVPTVGSPPWFNLIQGKTYVDVSNGVSDGDLTYLNVVSVPNVSGGVAAAGSIDGFPNISNLVLQGEPNSGSNVGYDKLYCALIGKGTYTWGASTIAVDGISAITQKTLTVKTVGANIMFAPGDVLYDENDRLMGTVKSVDSATVMTMEDNLSNASVDDAVLYNASPIKLILSFEQ